MATDGDDDAMALQNAIAHGLKPGAPENIEFIVDVLNREQRDHILRRLKDGGYECDAWDDPVSKSLSIYAARVMPPTLEAILMEKEAIKHMLADMNVSVEDWGIAISP